MVETPTASPLKSEGDHAFKIFNLYTLATVDLTQEVSIVVGSEDGCD